MARTRRGSAVKKGLKFFVFGKEGTRKSTFCLDALRLKREDGNPMRVAYIDTEGGSVDNYLEDIEAEGINLDNLFMIYTSSYKEVNEWVEKLVNEEDLFETDDEGEETDDLILDADGEKFVADFIVIDSATVIKDTLTYSKIEVSEIRAKLKAKSREATASEQFVAEATAGMELKDYGKLNHEGKHFLQSLITKTDKYVAVTSRETRDNKKTKNKDGSIESIDVGFKPNCFKDAEYEFFTVLRLFEDENDGQIKAKVMRKDRTRVFEQNEIIEEPSIMYWQQVIESNKNKKNAVQMGDYEDAVKTDIDEKTKKLQEKELKKETTEENPSLNLYDALMKKREGFSTSQRRQLTTDLKTNKLPARPTKDMDVETLQKMLDIAEEIK